MQCESAVTMEMKVNHTAATASGREQLALASADAFTRLKAKRMDILVS